MNIAMLLSLSMMVCAITGNAEVINGKENKLYPQGEPNSNGLDYSSFDPKRDINEVQALDAAYYVYLPQKGVQTTSQAVLILPGGGYRRTAMDHEGHQVARWLNEQGVAAVVLRYRMPNRHHEIPLSDVRHMYAIMQQNATQWGFDPAKIGVMGFSAGGHLASTFATHFTSPDERPAFCILFYPVITMGDDVVHRGSRANLLGDTPSDELKMKYSNEMHVTKQTPPTLLILADDDKTVAPLNSVMYYNALHKSGVTTQLLIYPKGGHGFGFRESFAYRAPMLVELKRTMEGWR